MSYKNQLGEGSFGSVWKAIDTSTNKPVIIKMIKKDFLTTKLVFNEIYILYYLTKKGCATCVGFIDAFYDDKYYYIVIEYLQNYVDLEEYLIEYALPDNNKITIIKNIYFALLTLHKLHVAHVDLKPANIMINTA